MKEILQHIKELLPLFIIIISAILIVAVCIELAINLQMYEKQLAHERAIELIKLESELECKK